MKDAHNEMDTFQEVLEQKETDLAQILRRRDGITIEKSADQMDEIQYAAERDLAIRNVDRESKVMRQVRAALQRIQDGSFGTCIECDGEISLKRLSAVPWAARCIRCQEVADRNGEDSLEPASEAFADAA